MGFLRHRASGCGRDLPPPTAECRGARTRPATAACGLACVGTLVQEKVKIQEQSKDKCTDKIKGAIKGRGHPRVKDTIHGRYECLSH